MRISPARNKGAKDYQSATRDVARLLEGLKKEKVDGVLIDLRNNGGGSLAEAIDLTGLFIDHGPVVQQRNADGQISVESDTPGRGGLGWAAGGADQPQFGLGLGDFCRRHPGLWPRPDHRRAELRQRHRANRGRPRSSRPQEQAGTRRTENDDRAVFSHQWRHHPVTRRDAGYRASFVCRCRKLRRIEFRQCAALVADQGRELFARRRLAGHGAGAAGPSRQRA